jgi:microcystin-dependent protein
VPFFVVLSPQTSSEEKMLVTISGATLTIVSRALDGTSAGSHASGASIYPVFTATDADEANELTAKYAAQGSIVYQGASTFAELTIGTANHVLKVNSGVPQWGQITADGIGTGAVTSEKILNNTIALGDLATALQAFLVPVGTIVAYPGASAPTGWLLCNGTSTTGYTALAALVGATTPDFQGHTLVGKGSAPFNGALLSKFGSTTSTAAHTHEVYHDHGNQDTGGDSAEHTHDILLSSTPSGDLTTVAPSAGTGLIAQGSNTSAVTSSGRSVGHTHPVNILPNQVTSGDSSVTTAHGNVQPSALVNYIIKHD